MSLGHFGSRLISYLKINSTSQSNFIIILAWIVAFIIWKIYVFFFNFGGASLIGLIAFALLYVYLFFCYSAYFK
jgi:hypothetical protein